MKRSKVSDKVPDIVAAVPLAFILLLAEQGLAQEELREPGAEDYNLSMAGALISDWCGRQWQEEEFISRHACNYAISQRYDLETSSTHFTDCAVANGGDIIMIADCMTARFNDWIGSALAGQDSAGQ